MSDLSCFVSPTCSSVGTSPSPSAITFASRRTSAQHFITSVQRFSLADNLNEILFGNLLDAQTNRRGDQSDTDDPNKELSRYANLFGPGSADDCSQAHASLSYYLAQWGRTLEDDKGNGIATPVISVPLKSKPGSIRPVKPDDGANCGTGMVVQTSGVKLKFKNRPRFLNQKEQKGLDKGIIPDRKGAKIDAWSPGGVELLVQTVETVATTRATNRRKQGETDGTTCRDENEPEQRLRLVARRCDIDGDTIIKVSSERAIVRRLDEAVRVWIRMRTDYV